MEIWLILALVIGIFIMDFRPLMHRRRKRELWVYGSMVLISTAALICQNAGLTIPSPTLAMRVIIGTLFHMNS